MDDQERKSRLDRGAGDYIVKGVLSAAVGILGYFVDSLLERVRRNEEYTHRLEIVIRSEMLSRQEFREQMNQFWSKR